MKKTLVQCITAIVCVIAIAITASSAVGTLSNATIKAAEKQAEAASKYAEENKGNGSGNNVTPVNGGDVNEDPTTPAGEEETTTAANGETPTTPNGSEKKSGAPSTKAEIVKYYNDAMNKLHSSKAGFSKKRHTDLGSLEGAEKIMSISVAKDAVYNFLGVGDKTFTNKKGEAKYLTNAALTEADVKSATCTPNGSTYTITLTLNDGKSSASDSGKSDNSPLKRSGLSVGADDKSEYDYKSAVNIYTTLKVTKETDITAVQETTSKTTITMTVDSATGKITSYKASWHWDATLTDVKYLVVKISGIGHADTTVSLSGFQW